MLSIVSVVLWSIAGVILVSFSGQGVLLASLHQSLIENFGITTLILPFLFITAGLMISQAKLSAAKPNVFWGGMLFFFAVLGLLRSGHLGSDLAISVSEMIHPIGAIIVFLGLSIVGLMVMTETSIDELFAIIGSILSVLTTRKAKLPKPSMPKLGKGMKITGVGEQMKLDEAKADQAKPSDIKVNQPKPTQSKTTDKTTSPTTLVNTSGKPTVWQRPPVSLLSTSNGGKAERGDLKKNAATIESVLDSFGIKARVVEVNCGPAVTQYALEISLGTKLSKITSLQNDLALALAAPTGQIRIEAPIPGRSMVGVEIPNISPEFVTLRAMLSSKSMKQNKSTLAVALGLDVSGKPITADIAKMPHILIAGATGSGKSVSLNAFLASILFRSSPDEVKFILVDPKRVELTGYNGIPHLLTPVIVEPEKVVSALKWAVTQMHERYKLLAEVGVRNIASYNELSGFQAMPYIVIVIDELADIMLFAPKDVEESITKIAQMARAVGIHLVLATQRPSVDVLTGLIKANVPTRMAFNVASMVDSRVIIDSPGAEKLLGKGDMLFIPPDQSKPTRIQGTYVSDDEINKMIDFLKQTGVKPQYTEEVTKKFAATSISGVGGTELENVDDKFKEAVEAVIQHKRASASLLQRVLSIGYARAARVLDQLEQAGVVSASDGSSKPREVLISSAEEFFSSQE